MEQRENDDVRPFAAGFAVGILGGLTLGSVIVGLFGSDLSSAVRQLARAIRRSDDDDHVNFELLMQ